MSASLAPHLSKERNHYVQTIQIELIDELSLQPSADMFGLGSPSQLSLDEALVRRERGEEVVFGKCSGTYAVLPAAIVDSH